MTAAKTKKARSGLQSPEAVREAGADGRARQTRGEARRAQIIAEAAALFAANGYRGTSIADVAERVGMTDPGLLYYFGSKERLLHEVVQDRHRIEQEGALGDAEVASLRRMPEVARTNAKTAVFVRLFAVLATENIDEGAPLHDYFVNRYETARKVTRTAIQADIARGDIRSDVNVTQLAREIVATLMGLEIQWLMDPRTDYVATVDAYTTGLLERLRPD